MPHLRPLALSALVIALAGCATTMNPAAPITTPVAAAKAATKAAITDATKPAAATPSPATTPAAAPSAARPGGSTAASAPTPPAPGTPPPPRPFADVIKDATESKGWFTTYQKDDKVWLEVAPDQFEMPFAFNMNITHGIGEKGLYGNSMGAYGAAGRSLHIAALRKFSPTAVQLISLNATVGPKAKSSVGLAVERAFSDSLLGTAPIVSAPHPERKSVLVEINPLLLTDLAHISFQLEQSFKQSYALDARNSSFAAIRSSDDQLGVNVKLHYGLARLNVPPPGGPTPPTALPSMLPDVRSLFMGVQYNISKLPDEPMPARTADQRVGYFFDTVYLYDKHEERMPKQHYINRWRLEKKDAAAALSEPKQPIVFWLDKNIPEKYRPAIRDGILVWNQAFERIGFKDAILVKQQTIEDTFDTSDTRHASVRWFIGKDTPFGARGPSVTDPRTGEILDADIEFSEAQIRGLARIAGEDISRTPQATQHTHTHADGRFCNHAHEKFSDVAFALELLEARGGFARGSAQADAFIFDGIRDTTAHEVGHVLGLRHNFRGSTIYTEAQISDPVFTKANGLTGSVMDYNPVNISLATQKQADFFMTKLGPYDFWAIEYGYKPLSRETESQDLKQIAGRSAEPLLAYATDEDAGWPGLEGIDPEVNRSDLTNEPLAHYVKRLRLTRELWDALQNRQFAAGESYEMLRRNFDLGFTRFALIADLASKYVGGIAVLRDYTGTGRLPLNPTSVETQRAAINLLSDSLFSEDNFKFTPQFLNRLSINFIDREDQLFSPGGAGLAPSPSLSLPERILRLQRDVLTRLTSDGVARRLVDSQALSLGANQPLAISELYGTLQSKIWSELDSNTAITANRRALQREMVRWYAWTLKRDTGNTPGDARVIVRAQAKQLLAKLESAKRSPGLSAENRAHLEDAFDQIQSSLSAVSQRVGA